MQKLGKVLYLIFYYKICSKNWLFIRLSPKQAYKNLSNLVDEVELTV